MTEKDAWEFLAILWQNGPAARIGGTICYGLCASIDRLETAKFIESCVAAEMRRKIPMQYNQPGYLWPLDELGAKQRVRFCCRMAMKSDKTMVEIDNLLEKARLKSTQSSVQNLLYQAQIPIRRNDASDSQIER